MFYMLLAARETMLPVRGTAGTLKRRHKDEEDGGMGGLDAHPGPRQLL